MRGDRPSCYNITKDMIVFTPHARGSTHLRSGDFIYGIVYPACAGIDPTDAATGSIQSRLPRMRGDRPRIGTSV